MIREVLYSSHPATWDDVHDMRAFLRDRLPVFWSNHYHELETVQDLWGKQLKLKGIFGIHRQNEHPTKTAMKQKCKNIHCTA